MSCQSQSAKLLSCMKLLFLGMPRSRSALKALNSLVPGSCLKTRVAVSHYTQYIRVCTKAAQQKLSSAVCFTGERKDPPGICSPDLALKWEEAAQHLPITAPETCAASSTKNWMKRQGSRPLSLSCPLPAPPSIHPNLGCQSSLPPATWVKSKQV